MRYAPYVCRASVVWAWRTIVGLGDVGSEKGAAEAI